MKSVAVLGVKTPAITRSLLAMGVAFFMLKALAAYHFLGAPK